MAYHRTREKSGSSGTSTPDKYIEIFSEFDFVHTENSCDFFCPDCRRITECMAYDEVKDGWESFYM